MMTTRNRLDVRSFQKTLVAGTFILSLGLPAVAHAQWTAPLGIPAPSFGISQVAPASPNPWVAATPGHYYVDGSQATATDSANPYGTPAKPRQTIPTTLPAGAIVELRGTYDTYQGSPNTIVVNGTATNPVYIRGQSPTVRPLVRNYWEIQGTYAILENLEFAPLNDGQTGSLTILAPSNNLALRNSDLHGTTTDGGLGIESWDAGTTNSNIVIYKNTIHDNGDVNADYDQDVHGIHVGVRAASIWVVDNEMARNSGDGIQINAASAADQATTNHIYVGRNYSHDNKQTGFWAKQAVDVIFSQNECANHRPGNSSYGQCMGYQYATDQIWFLFNKIHDSDFGIGVSDDNDLGTGTEAYFIGNVIYKIHHTTSDSQSDSGWGNAAIMLAGGLHRYVINNTIYDVDAGVNSPSPDGTLEIADNIISDVAQPGNHVFIEMDSLANATLFHHDLLYGDPRLRWAGGPQTHPTADQLATVQSLTLDPQFVDPLNANFHIPVKSPAAGSGELNPVYAAFARRYGLSITLDADGISRAGSATADMGAYVAGGVAPAIAAPSAPAPATTPACSSTSAPSAPTGLIVSQQNALTLTLAWTAPSACSSVTGYVIEAGTASGLADAARQPVSAATTAMYPLLPGTFYIRVRATNRAGTSGPSNEVMVGGVPGAPTRFAATIAGATWKLSWQAPTTGGAVASYVVEAGSKPGSADYGVATVAAPATTLVGPVDRKGLFYIRIKAVSPSGTGPASNEVVVTAR